MPVTKKNRLNRASKAHNKTIRTSKSKRRRNSKKKSIRTSKGKRSKKRSSRKKSKRSSRKKSKKGNSHIMKGGGVTLIDEEKLELDEDTYYIFLKGFDAKTHESTSIVYDEQIFTDIKDKFNKSQKKNLCIIWDGDAITDNKFTRLVKSILVRLTTMDDEISKSFKPITKLSAIAFKQKNAKKNPASVKTLKENVQNMKNDMIDVQFCTIEINEDKINKYFNETAIKTNLPDFAKEFTTLALTIYEHFLKIPNFKFSADNCFFVCLGGGGIAKTEMEVLFGTHQIQVGDKHMIFEGLSNNDPVKLYPVSRRRLELNDTILDFFIEDKKKYICPPCVGKNPPVDPTEILGYNYKTIMDKINSNNPNLNILKEKLLSVERELRELDTALEQAKKINTEKPTEETEQEKQMAKTKKEDFLKDTMTELVNICSIQSVQNELQFVLKKLKPLRAQTSSYNKGKERAAIEDALREAKHAGKKPNTTKTLHIPSMKTIKTNINK